MAVAVAVAAVSVGYVNLGCYVRDGGGGDCGIGGDRRLRFLRSGIVMAATAEVAVAVTVETIGCACRATPPLCPR